MEAVLEFCPYVSAKAILFTGCFQLITEHGGDNKAGSLLKDGGPFWWMTLAKNHLINFAKSFLELHYI